MSDTYVLAAAVSLIIIVFALVFAVLAVRQASRTQALGKRTAGRAGRPPGGIWIVANPTKPANYARFKTQVEAQIEEATGQKPQWLETTIEDPGTGQAVEALRHRPEVVVAAGGDGTVRAVAAAMAHSGVPLGLLPQGTGNLLARNLGLPLEQEAAVDVILGSISRPMDIAWLALDDVDEEAERRPEGTVLGEAVGDEAGLYPKGVVAAAAGEYSYLVIAGIGFDGETMAQTRPQLKERVGWSAYVLTALRSLRIERMRARITAEVVATPKSDGLPWRTLLPAPVDKAVEASQTLGHEDGISPAVSRSQGVEITETQARTVLIANCGELPFAKLAPEAAFDDGALDVVAVDTRAGLVGWSVLAVKVLGHSLGLRSVNVKYDAGSIQFQQARRVRVQVSKPYPIQVDGDAIGRASTMTARVDAHALTVKVPQEGTDYPSYSSEGQ
mgnify:CR=1 FL=1